MKKQIILGHQNPDVDSIVSGILLEKFLNKVANIDAEFVIPDESIEEETKNICTTYEIDINSHCRKLTDADQEFILVDHNQREVNGKITGIIDHHPPYNNPNNLEFYLNEPASSTAILIVKNDELFFNKKELEQAVIATLIDTVSFNSSKTRKIDKLWIEKIIKDYNLNQEKLEKSALYLTNLNKPNVFLNGLKKYQYEDNIFESSYIQVENPEENQSKINSIINNLINYTIDNNLETFIFIVHDMTNFKTTTYEITKDNIEIKNYDQYTSRGNIIIPKHIEKLSQPKRSSTK